MIETVISESEPSRIGTDPRHFQWPIGWLLKLQWVSKWRFLDSRAAPIATALELR